MAKIWKKSWKNKILDRIQTCTIHHVSHQANLTTKACINKYLDFVILNTGIGYLAVDGLSLKA